MIDLFCIFTTGGLIIWSKSFVSEGFEEVLNELIRTILMEEKHTQEYYVPKCRNTIILRWRIINESNLIFVLAYQQSFSILYSDKLLDLVVKDFRDNRLNKLNHNKNIFFETCDKIDYNSTFMNLLSKWEKFCKDEMENKNKSKLISNSTKNKNYQKVTTVIPSSQEENKEKNLELLHSNSFIPGASNNNIVIRKNQNRNPKSSKNSKSVKGKTKELRVWDDQPKNIDEKTISQYDQSKNKKSKNNKDNNTGNDKNDNNANNEQEDEEENKKIQQYKDKFLGDADPDNLDETSFDEIDSEKNSSSSNSKGIFSKLSNSLKSYIGNKVLTEEDLNPVMEQLITLLMEKNVAKEIAENLCASVKKSLLNTKTSSFTTISTTVKNALKESIAKILTPKEELDLLRSALSAKKRGEPYKIVFIGVNGVGKSTSLAKVAYMLMNNGLKILIAACDNFRSGAVEQLKTHSKALGVDLYEKGYKDDPAYICKEAIEEAKKNYYDCVLIDTAGRMQDNEPLMKSLTKLVEINQPDAILFVGEALTGNDSVDQLKKFNQCLIDYSKKEKPRTIDGILLTKFDTVDDKVGAALTMVYTTGKPIVYVGTGQKYINLKKLNVNNVLNALFG